MAKKSKTTTPKPKQATNIVINVQPDSNRVMYATWDWSRADTKDYKVRWAYQTASSTVWFQGSESTVTHHDNVVDVRLSTYTPPENAKRVSFQVLPEANEKKSGKKKKAAWTAEWSGYAYKDVPAEKENATLAAPSTPTVTISGNKVKASVNYSAEPNSVVFVDFEFVKNNNVVVHTERIRRVTNYAECTVTATSDAISYKVRVRGFLQSKNRYSVWSEYGTAGDALPKPSTPSVNHTEGVIMASLSYTALGATQIIFQFVKNDGTANNDLVEKWVSINAGYASVNIAVAVDAKRYRIRACSYSAATKRTSEWTEYAQVDLSTVEKPSAPNVTIENGVLKAEIDNYTYGASHVYFEVVKNNTTRVATSGGIAIVMNHAEYTYKNVEINVNYKVRVRILRYSTQTYSPWSEYSANQKQDPSSVTPIDPPSVPTVSIESGILTAEVTNYNQTGTYKVDQIEFEIVKNNVTKVLTKKVALSTNLAKITYKIALDTDYKVRCRAYDSSRKKSSAWSEYSNNERQDREPLEAPSAPNGEIVGTKFKASLDVNPSTIPNNKAGTAKDYQAEFQIVKNDKSVLTTKKVAINLVGHAELSVDAAVNTKYKARVRYYSVSQNRYSTWSDYSGTAQRDLEPIGVPPVPSVSITNNVFKAFVNCYVEGATHIEFQTVKNNSTLVQTKRVALSKNYAQTTLTAEYGVSYKTRARVYVQSSNRYSAWSEYGTTEPVEFSAPPVPQISITNFQLTAEVSVYILGATHIQFQIVKNDKTVVKTQQVAITTNNARITYKVAADTRYKVRARCYSSTRKLYSGWSEYSSSQLQEKEPLGVPPVPEATISAFTLTATVDIYVALATGVQFQVVKDNKTVVKTVKATIKTNRAAMSCAVSAGGKYKVRARSYNAAEYSDWSEYSSEAGTVPGKVAKITSLKSLSSTSIQLTWQKATDAKNYEIQYTDNKSYFDKNVSEVKSVTVEATVTTAIVTGLEGGKTWFFRVRATNDNGNGGFSPISSLVIGTVPSAPTTWSYTTTVKIGEVASLNWSHNSEDESEQTAAQIEITINGSTQTITVNGATNHYNLATTSYSDGSIINWRVRTKGAIASYGAWSTKRTITVYAPPGVELGMYGSVDWAWDTFNFETDTIYTAAGDETDLIDEVNRFPFIVKATATPSTQTAVSFVLTVTANEAYDTLDETGMQRRIGVGEQVYSKYFTPDEDDPNVLKVRFTPADIDLQNNISYTVHVTAALSSGLDAEDEYEFSVAWEDDLYAPDARISIDEDILAAYIQPFCDDGYGHDAEGLTLSVYRREYNGTFTEIETGIKSGQDITVTDPHPSLDYARYRIVAVSDTNGDISFYDVPAQPIGHNAIVIQWDEEWTYFDVDSEDEMVQPPWNGSMLQLPYNVDVSIDNKPDVALVEYIGRAHPVSYYGTQKGETATWSAVIEKDDEESLYSLRRLANYSGDVYVREPSGIGYWAQVNVGYNLSHNSKEVPVTLGITRVDGGM